MSKKLQILHVINNLATGGAESMLVRLATALRDEFDQRVLCILDRGPLAGRLETVGIPVESLDVSERVPSPLAVFRLARRIRAARPNVVQTWLYQSDLMGGLAARMAGARNIVWNLRGGDFSLDEAHPVTRIVVRACATLSRSVPLRIVCCGERVQADHVRLGYDGRKLRLIHNGIDVTKFRPDPEAAISVRQELDIPLTAPLIGLIGRFHPAKDHQTFFAAAALLTRSHPDARFLLAGKGVSSEDSRIQSMLHAHGLTGAIYLLGERHDVPRLTAALDIGTSSSWGEGFPNVIAEAMACGIPCVATDAGDARLIVGDTGRIVPRRDPTALAEGWSQLLSLDASARMDLGATARQRIEQSFNLERSVQAYASLYRELAEAD